MTTERSITFTTLAVRLAEKIGKPKGLCETVIKGLIDLLNDSAVNREQVYLHGLGAFKVQDMKARKGRNPKTMEEIAIPAKLRLVFTPAKHLKDI